MKTPSSHPTLFSQAHLHSFVPSSSVFPLQVMGNGGCGRSVTDPLCCSFLITFSRSCRRIPALGSGPPSHPPSSSWCSQGCFSHSSPHSSLLGSILHFLTQAFPKVLPSWLWGSAESCSGSVGAGWNQLYPAWGCSQRLPCRQHLPALGICTLHSISASLGTGS